MVLWLTNGISLRFEGLLICGQPAEKTVLLRWGHKETFILCLCICKQQVKHTHVNRPALPKAPCRHWFYGFYSRQQILDVIVKLLRFPMLLALVGFLHILHHSEQLEIGISSLITNLTELVKPFCLAQLVHYWPINNSKNKTINSQENSIFGYVG